VTERVFFVTERVFCVLYPKRKTQNDHDKKQTPNKHTDSKPTKMSSRYCDECTVDERICVCGEPQIISTWKNLRNCILRTFQIKLNSGFVHKYKSMKKPTNNAKSEEVIVDLEFVKECCPFDTGKFLDDIKFPLKVDIELTRELLGHISMQCEDLFISVLENKETKTRSELSNQLEMVLQTQSKQQLAYLWFHVYQKLTNYSIKPVDYLDYLSVLREEWKKSNN
jgi:hypothetical protein